jgi:hypothetical protein
MEKEPGRRSARLGLRAMYSAPRATPSGNQRSKRDGKAANAARLIASKSNCNGRRDLAERSADGLLDGERLIVPPVTRQPAQAARRRDRPQKNRSLDQHAG